MQAADGKGRVVWSAVHHVPHCDLAAKAAFVVLSTGNGTAAALTLSGSHMVYLADAATGSRVPAAARDVEVGAAVAMSVRLA